MVFICLGVGITMSQFNVDQFLKIESDVGLKQFLKPGFLVDSVMRLGHGSNGLTGSTAGSSQF